MIWILGADGMVRALAEILRDKGPILSAVGEAAGRQVVHPPWEGFHFYDLIFPLFIFVTGIAIVFSLTRIVEREGMARAHVRVLRRSALLFGLGILFYGGFANLWPDIRLLGVLQRIALCYLAASLLFLHLSPPAMAAVFVSLLVGYWALLTFVPAPGAGSPTFEEGATFANWIDEHYLPGSKWFQTWDPEGLLSTLPAIATCLLGVFAGLLFMDRRISAVQKSRWLIFSGFVMLAVGHLWALQFPIIKNIWTSSFVLVAGGWSVLLLGVFHQVIDVRGHRAWATALIWVGSSAILLYLVNNAVEFVRLAHRFVGGDVARLAEAHVAAGTSELLSHGVALAMAITLAGFLYRRRIFLRL